MKSYFTVFCFLMFFLVSIFTTSFAQTNWTKYPGNPVLTPGPYNSWEDYTVYSPFVLKDGDTLKMWYTGSKSFDVDHIGYATSTDGIHWQKDSANPVLLAGAPGSWDDEVVSHPKIILIDTTYHMWYGGTDINPYTAYRIGYATSPDGINWTKADSVNPVLDLGEPGEWDSATLAGHSYFFDGDTFHMWYSGSDNTNFDNTCIGYAKSPDGINWVRYPGNPVFRGTSSWNSLGVLAPCVIVDSSGYKMWYQGTYGSYDRIGYVTSSDGINWTVSGSFVLDVGGWANWDHQYVSHPHVFNDATSYYMWYAGGRSDTGSRIGYATAPVTINVPGDLPTIQAAIDAASDGNVVLVADGTYQENINFIGKAITVASHFYIDGDTSHISNTVIDGDSSGSVVTFESGEDSTTVLCGFTLTNGYSITTSAGGGGGICILNSSPIISNITILNNFAIRGGGIYLVDSDAIITHVTIHSNQAEAYPFFTPDGLGGGICCASSDLILTEVKIKDNMSHFGGGIYCRNSNLNLMNVIISDNNAFMGGGIGFVSWFEGDMSNVFLSNVTIKNNHAINSFWPFGDGGGITGAAHTRLYFDPINRCNIYNNSADSLGNDLFSLTDSVISVIVDTFTTLYPDSSHAYPLEKFTFHILHDTSGNLNKIEKVNTIPLEFTLNQNYPNPFNPRTNIEFSIPNTEFVTLKIYNILGQEVATLFSDKLKAGSYNYSWDAGSLASGVYLYQLQTGEHIETRKMVLLR
jgi:predicted GH43/DUF377 family glycosyl hydrolase